MPNLATTAASFRTTAAKIQSTRVPFLHRAHQVHQNAIIALLPVSVFDRRHTFPCRRNLSQEAQCFIRASFP